MSNPTDILGKIGKKVGEEIKGLSDDIADKADTSALTAHTGTVTGNPHGVTASDVGLGNVDNVSLNSWAGSANITTVGTLANGTIPYSLLTGVPDLNSITGDLTIGGNLTVNGTQTILKTQTLEVEDNEIELNLGTSGAETAQTSGIAINRGVGSATNNSGFSGTLGFQDSSHTGSGWDAAYGNGGSTVGVVSGQLVVDYNSTGTDVVATDAADPLNTMQSGWSITNVTYNANGGATAFDLTFSGSGSALDKAKLQWDDTNSKWSFLVGTTKATVEAGVVAVPDKDGITINGVSLGDYSEFETAFLAAL